MSGTLYQPLQQHSRKAFENPTASEILGGGGQMGALMRSFDWSQTPFGPVDTWPQSLRTAVSIMLASRFAMVIAWGPDFRFLYNDRYRPVLGTSKHPGALGTPARDIFPEIWHVIGPLFEKASEEAVAFDDLYLPLDRHGYLENCWFTLSYSPIRDETGGAGGILAVVTETTERVQGERRLRTLRDLARRAADAKNVEEACRNAAATLGENVIDVPFALLYLFESDGTQARLASAAGLAPGTAASPTLVDLAASVSDQNWPLGEVSAQRQPRVLNDLFDRFGALPSGPYPEHTRSALMIPMVRPGLKHLDGVLIFGISPRRALDEQYRTFLELASDQILTAIRNALAYQEERERAEKLAELDRAKTIFFNNVSHEFRTPLTLMLGPLEDLLNQTNGPLAPAQREQLAVTHRNSLRLLKLVNTLLDFSRIEAGRIHAHYEPTDLAPFTSDLCGVFRAAIEKAGMRLVLDCPPLPEPVYVDRDMWEKIVLNLLSNAFKFTFKGEIEVRMRATGTAVEVCVRDTGIGIPEYELPSLFQRFHRVEGARGRTFEGTGIGLALVQELVKLQGGSISVKSALGIGTEFTIVLPLGHAHLQPERIDASSPLAPTSLKAEAFVSEALHWLPEGNGKPPAEVQLAIATGLSESADTPLSAGDQLPRNARVLVADDNADMRQYVRRLLSPDCQVTAVGDGVAALALARAQRPDLILTDVMMPQMDGFELLRAIRADPQLQTIPVIMLSARAGEESRVDGLGAGADDYLIKPFSARELVARVESHLKMARLRQQAFAREKALEHEVEIRKQQAEHILENITDGFLALDAHWRVTYINKTAERLMGRSAADLLSKDHWQEFPGTIDTRLEHEFRRAMAEKISVEFENFYEPWQRWFEIKAYGSPQGLGVYFRDITDRKRDEAEIRRAKDELARANQDLEKRVQARTASLREAVAQMEEFSYSVSHDLRSPLRAMQGYATALFEDYAHQIDAQGKEYLDRIIQGSARMERLIHDVLTYSRVSRMEMRLRTVPLDPLVRAVLRQYPELDSKRADILIEGNLPAVVGHEPSLGQAVANVLKNAVKFIPKGAKARVEITAHRQDGNVILRCKDNGIGIKREHQDRLFGMFERIHPDEKYEGTGIGLAIVRKTVERMGGKVGVESDGIQGSTFWIQLPEARPAGLSPANGL